jgi:oligoribonuclease
MADPTCVAWLDLETTDTDEKVAHAAVLELGLVITDFDLDPIMSTQAVINPGLDDLLHREPDEVLATIYELMNPYVQQLHDQNGLWDEVKKSDLSITALDEALLGVYQDVGDGNLVALAGSGVSHFDGRWLKKFLPRSSSLFTHYSYDVGTVRRFLRDLCGADVTPADPSGASSGDAKAHRALADAWAHLNEARAYRDALRGVKL